MLNCETASWVVGEPGIEAQDGALIYDYGIAVGNHGVDFAFRQNPIATRPGYTDAGKRSCHRERA